MQFAAKFSEIPDWGKKVVVVAGTEIILVKIKGEIFACESECPHQGAPLSGALVKEADHITCGRHGWHFNLKTGACREDAKYTLKIYHAEMHGDEIYVDLG